MNEQRQFDFLDVITIFALGLQMQGYIEQAPQNSQLSRIERKLDIILSKLNCEENTSSEGMRP